MVVTLKILDRLCPLLTLLGACPPRAEQHPIYKMGLTGLAEDSKTPNRSVFRTRVQFPAAPPIPSSALSAESQGADQHRQTSKGVAFSRRGSPFRAIF